MARYLLYHRHEPDEAGVVFTSFKGHDSPLCHRPTLASCRSGGHAIWWTVEAGSEDGALALLPFYVARPGSRDGVVGSRKLPQSRRKPCMLFS